MSKIGSSLFAAVDSNLTTGDKRKLLDTTKTKMINTLFYFYEKQTCIGPYEHTKHYFNNLLLAKIRVLGYGWMKLGYVQQSQRGCG